MSDLTTKPTADLIAENYARRRRVLAEELERRHKLDMLDVAAQLTEELLQREAALTLEADAIRLELNRRKLELNRRKVVDLAKKAAALFHAEFDEELDPAQTDWDAAAWEMDRNELGLTAKDLERMWPIYQAALVAETKRLTV